VPKGAVVAAFIPFHAYEASAGSGKTFSLVVRYLSLLFMGEDADKILALTFTNKAASEMQERIIETLRGLSERKELAAIAEVTGMSEEAILSKRAAVTEHFLGADTKVMTIDRFFAKILRKFSLYAGLMPDFSTFESQHELKVMLQFLLLAELQGKEKTLIDLALMASRRLSDIFKLLDELYSKSKELDRKAFSPAPYAPFAESAMRELAVLQNFVNSHPDASKTAKSGMKAKDIYDLVGKSWLQRESFNYRTYSKIYDPAMDLSLEIIKRHVHDYMLAREQHFMYGLFSLLEIYEEAKRRVAKEDGELGFDDITMLVYYLLKERIDSEFLYFRLDSRISHLLLDEFQDTSIVQFDILRPIIEEIVAGAGIWEHGSLFLVGDVKQSIYRFRGGASELFYAVTDLYGIQVDRLLTNYRSSKNVVEFVNGVFKDKMDRYEEQRVRSDANDGYVEVVCSDKLLESAGEQIAKLVSKGVAANDIAVLTATNADGMAVEEHLRGCGIEVVTESTSRLINQKNIRALIEYLKYSYFNEAIYARNFFALIETEPAPLQRCDPGSSDLAGEIGKIVEKYHLYDGDLNLLRFLEKLSDYRDIEQFLFEYERLDTEAARADLKGVRVMTVHKSKGLEFDHVIVLDRLGRAAGDSSPIIYEYDGLRLQRIFLRMRNREELDRDYAAALDKEKALSAQDELNALYVAFTRAKESLFVIQKSENSKFDMLGLSEQSRGELSFKSSEVSEKTSGKALPYKFLYYGTQSDLLKKEEKEEQDLYAIEFGLAMHYTLEMMEGFNTDALRSAMTGTKNRFGSVLDEAAFVSLQKRIALLCESREFALLCAGVIHKEKPISYNKELRYIDLLVERKEGWIVIDYKSSQSHAEEHFKQVGFYKKAVAGISGDKVEGYLCYLLEDGIKLVKV
jgi:exodeoxyribonuclease V beta subunit